MLITSSTTNTQEMPATTIDPTFLKRKSTKRTRTIIFKKSGKLFKQLKINPIVLLLSLTKIRGRVNYHVPLLLPLIFVFV